MFPFKVIKNANGLRLLRQMLKGLKFLLKMRRLQLLKASIPKRARRS
jgi:hypothetical protein